LRLTELPKTGGGKTSTSFSSTSQLTRDQRHIMGIRLRGQYHNLVSRTAFPLTYHPSSTTASPPPTKSSSKV
jgi:hypothetical protein